ncbi:hypothetical protein AB0F17_66095 [Nonomuraea sp. NPDC026600]|uniref:hypothetical protein n=1 Tax=Nonomuraea sp. NPDC026600 TaxID=3155363 RepID=UPI0033C2DD09
MTSTYLGSRVDDIDAQMDRVASLIDSAGRIDRELAAGLGCNASMASVQVRIDTALANTESLLKAVRAATKK